MRRCSRRRQKRRGGNRRKTHRANRRAEQKGGAEFLQVVYGQTPVQNGQLLQKSQTQSAPTLPNLPSLLQPNTPYLLVLYDPDVPAQAKPGYLHWLIKDITQENPNGVEVVPHRSKGATGKVASSTSSARGLVPYQGPNPPPGSGTHRYIFTVAEQRGDVSAPQGRAHFNGPAFLQGHGPVLADTYFRIEAAPLVE